MLLWERRIGGGSQGVWSVRQYCSKPQIPTAYNFLDPILD